MNQVSLIGRLTRDPEQRSTAAGKPVAGLRLAVPRRDRAADPVYVDVVAFSGLAETCGRYLGQGRQVAVQGRLEYREWKSDDGSKRSKHEVVAHEIDFLGVARLNGSPLPGADAPDEEVPF